MLCLSCSVASDCFAFSSCLIIQIPLLNCPWPIEVDLSRLLLTRKFIASTEQPATAKQNQDTMFTGKSVSLITFQGFVDTGSDQCHLISMDSHIPTKADAPEYTFALAYRKPVRIRLAKIQS